MYLEKLVSEVGHLEFPALSARRPAATGASEEQPLLVEEPSVRDSAPGCGSGLKGLDLGASLPAGAQRSVNPIQALIHWLPSAGLSFGASAG